ncbi:hypothetical protein EDB89DRAFT_1068645 [Lactarius sanguifluus]|nr:hypothetical protein EDB89DRAFT_1068645 [Lactarius sanguifluus]
MGCTVILFSCSSLQRSAAAECSGSSCRRAALRIGELMSHDTATPVAILPLEKEMGRECDVISRRVMHCFQGNRIHPMQCRAIRRRAKGIWSGQKRKHWGRTTDLAERRLSCTILRTSDGKWTQTYVVS